MVLFYAIFKTFCQLSPTLPSEQYCSFKKNKHMKKYEFKRKLFVSTFLLNIPISILAYWLVVCAISDHMISLKEFITNIGAWICIFVMSLFLLAINRHNFFKPKNKV